MLTATVAATTLPAHSEPLPKTANAGGLAQGVATDNVPTATGISSETPVTAELAREQESIPTPGSGKKDLTSFFLIGILINLLVLLVAGVWAYREWQRRS